jgi:hypothetical protein
MTVARLTPKRIAAGQAHAGVVRAVLSVLIMHSSYVKLL